jgi:hypothetical protein
MGYLEGLKFRLFRLKQESGSKEFLFYDVDNNIYNQYSKDRVIDYIKLELKSKYGDVKKLLQEIMNSSTYFNVENETNLNKIISYLIETESELLDGISYKPVDELIFIEEGRKYFNKYCKSNYLLNIEKGHKFPNIKRLVMNLCGNDKGFYDYFNKWLSWIIFNPTKKLPTAIIFKGDKGTGKSKFAELVLMNIFKSNYNGVTQNMINSEFNGYIVARQLICAEEVIHDEIKSLVYD